LADRRGCPREQVRPTRQRLPTARYVGLRYRNVNQCPMAEIIWDDAYYKATNLPFFNIHFLFPFENELELYAQARARLRPGGRSIMHKKFA